MPPRLLLLALVSAVLPYTNAKSLWSNSPANTRDVIRTTYPIGNGRLGAMPIGPPWAETLTLNLDTLWSGGPFDASSYTGGNPNSSIASALPGIRDWIFTNGTGNVTELLGPDGSYGSYQVLGNLSVAIPSIYGSGISNYTRSLDLKNGLHLTSFNSNGSQIETSAFCSFPDQVCVYTVRSDGGLPTLQVKLDNELVDVELRNATCIANGNSTDSGYLRLRGVTQLGPPEGMRYDSIARVLSNLQAETRCSSSGLMIITPINGTKSLTMIVSAETNYDIKKGTAEYGYSFRGEDPGPAVEFTTQKAAAKTLEELTTSHTKDFTSLTSRFELSLPDPLDSSQTPTSELVARYDSSSTSGDPYLENLLFDYAQYLFISSSRPGSLPPNLQGRWSEGLYAAWSADYHANINLQMNHWTADQTGLTDLQGPLWEYMARTWAPRGSETAELLYAADGWVVHNEMNIFGHTAMKSGEGWANYPAAAAWMMQHVFDHWDYSRDESWLRNTGYPMLKAIARFWLTQLQVDSFTDDATLVVNPCTSPEHGPTTFGCAHYQQLIHQVFDSVLSTHAIAQDADEAFVSNVSASLARLDKGFHVGAWGQIKEWKLPDSFGYEFINDTHRHLSELVGWHPGFSLSSFLGGYTNATVQDAVRQKLYSRGLGNGPDANSGWEKVWRAACWARLNDTQQAYLELRYAIEQNFVANGLSMYSGEETPFQIDANFGLGGAVLSMLAVDLPVAAGEEGGFRTVVLGPAIPGSWAGGSVKGLRLRGGGVVDFAWDDDGVVKDLKVVAKAEGVRIVNVRGEELTGS
ncbi:glycoside hydrolase family 95 protein [Stemphylium lycopersici]|uniref:Glycoside hydrolase family 95 protein n=1 Tax=Stemphylium lycopersici TaxID=183478 RepID=A0A364NBE0_STELY|nr:glycoside hydrolase family 95 protein [Stemphylium lycopersici]RAR12064.1 glycoside hydrolase family 95 protein [Stemphylium lycopersici]RAR14493.1 glycoside hydrolase family 95 protein [Stemphylium lycopersici]